MSEIINNENSWCVYIHISPSNKSYIGITSQKPEKRWKRCGEGYLRKNKDDSYAQPAMAHAIKKYSDWDLWQHIVFMDNLSKDDACKIERLLISIFQTTNQEYGYNISSGGDCTFFGRKHTDETKEKMSRAQTGKIVSDETKRKISESRLGEKNWLYGRRRTEVEIQRLIDVNAYRAKPVICLETKEIFSSAVQAHKKTGIARADIQRCCQKKPGHLTAGGLHWMFVSDYDESKIDEYLSIVKTYKYRQVICIETKMIYDSVKEVSEKTGISMSSIYSCCSGYQNTAGGFHWMYFEEYQKIAC